MTNKEFVDYCKAGDIEKVKEGIADKKINHSAWKSRALQYAHDGLIHTKTGKGNSTYSKIMDLLIQYTTVDPSIDVFIAIWSVKYCEFETTKLIFNHPNNIGNTALFNHSFQLIENAFLIERLDIAEFLLSLKGFKHQKALTGYIEWGKNTEKLDKLKLLLKFGGSLEKLEPHVIKILVNLIISVDDLDFFKLLLNIPNFDPSDNNNIIILLAKMEKATKIFDYIKDDYRIQETAVRCNQPELINKNIVDIFIF